MVLPSEDVGFSLTSISSSSFRDDTCCVGAIDITRPGADLHARQCGTVAKRVVLESDT